MTKNEMKEAMVEAICEVLWSDGFLDKFSELSSDALEGYFMEKEPYTYRDKETGKVMKTYTPVTAVEYLKSIESLLERIASALGA